MTTSTTSPRPAALAARLTEALAAGDLSAAAEVVHPDVVLHVPGAHPQAGDHRGAAGIAQFVAASAAAGAHTDRTVLDVLEGAEHVAVYCLVRGTRPGRAAMANHTLHLFRIEDGCIAEIWFHNRDQSTVDEFWS